MAVATTEHLQLAQRLFTVDEYEAMGRAGIFGPDERVELIEGQISAMNPIGTGHVWTVTRLHRIFARRDDVFAIDQSPILLGIRSQPQPDLVIVPADISQDRKPAAADTLLVVEVADTSLAYDRQTKGPLYARAGVPEYWLIDLNGERIEQYREPSPAGYRAMHLFLRGEHLSPAFAPALRISVDEVLGPPATPPTE